MSELVDNISQSLFFHLKKTVTDITYFFSVIVKRNFRVCRNDSIQRPGRLFTFGTSREDACSRQGAY